MNKWFIKTMQAIGYAGIGLFVAKRGIDTLYYKAKCKRFEKAKSELQRTNEMLNLRINNFDAIDTISNNPIIKEKAIDDNYDNTNIEIDEALDEDAKQIVDEMSDDEYKATLSYIRGDELD